MARIQDLPVELVDLVTSHLGAGALAAFARTSHKFFDIGNPALYRFAAEALDSECSSHPLRWAAENGQAGTLKKTLAAGIDPNMIFGDKINQTYRDMFAFQIRLEAIEGKDTRATADGDSGNERSPQKVDADEEGLVQRLGTFGSDRGAIRSGFRRRCGFRPTEPVRRRSRIIRTFCALHLAARGGHDEIVRILLDHSKIKIEALSQEICNCQLIGPRVLGRVAPKTSVRPTALHLAICHFRTSTAEILLLHGASTRLGGSDCFDTALHVAAKTGQRDLCKLLLDNGHVQDVDIKDSNHLTPFYSAYFNGHWDSTVPVLLERGANIDFDIPYEPVPAHSTCTVLYEAVRHGRYEDAIKLIHLGADVTKGLYTRGVQQATLLHVAAQPRDTTFHEPPESLFKLSSSAPDNEECRRKVIQALVGGGAEIDAKASGFLDKTPLHFAAQHNLEFAVQTLIFAGANVHMLDSMGLSALVYACLSPWMPVPKDGRNFSLRRCEHVIPGQLQLIGFLLDHGSKERINAVDLQGNTALHVLCQLDRPSEEPILEAITRLLLDHGARGTVRNGAGMTTFQVAYESGHFGICDILVRRRDIVLPMKREELDRMLDASIRLWVGHSNAFDLLYDLDVEGVLWQTSKHVLTMVDLRYSCLAWAYLRRKIPPLSPKEKSAILHAAAGDSDPYAVRQLLAIKAPVNLPDKDGHTPLYKLLNVVPRDSGTLDIIVRDLLGAGADPHYRHDGSQLPPLERAITSGYHSAVEIMLRHKPLGETPSAPKGVYLHAEARRKPSKRIINMLVLSGAKVTELDANGDTPLAVFLKKLLDGRQWTSINGMGAIICSIMWCLWGKDIDIGRKNKSGKSIWSYLTALRLYDGHDLGRLKIAEELQRRIQVVPVPSGKTDARTLRFATDLLGEEAVPEPSHPH